MTRVTAIIPARMDSTRLPGKALREVRGLPLLAYVLDRARRIPGVESVVLASTGRPVDRPLEAFAKARDLPFFKGDLEDVAGRFLACARSRNAERFIRMNGDSPFPDPVLLGEGVRTGEKTADLVTNLVGRTFPYGISVEVVRTEAFERACRDMTTADEHTHVTRRFYEKPEGFQIHALTSPHPDLKGARVVVDTEEDFKRFASAVDRLADNVFRAGYVDVARVYLDLQAQG